MYKKYPNVLLHFPLTIIKDQAGRTVYSTGSERISTSFQVRSASHLRTDSTVCVRLRICVWMRLTQVSPVHTARFKSRLSSLWRSHLLSVLCSVSGIMTTWEVVTTSDPGNIRKVFTFLFLTIVCVWPNSKTNTSFYCKWQLLLVSVTSVFYLVWSSFKK